MDLVHELQPELAPRVRLYNDRQAILEEHGVTGELERALHAQGVAHVRRLHRHQPDGGARRHRHQHRPLHGKKNLEDTILKTNLEAVKEIVRQIRLRDLGGIIVVDFIDMEERKSRQKVMAALEQELKKDRSPSKVLSVNEFGLVIITRKRVQADPGAHALPALPVLRGQRDGEERDHGVLGDLRRGAQARFPFLGQPVSLRVNPDVARALRADESTVLLALSPTVGHDVAVQGDPAPAPGAVRRGAAVRGGASAG